MRSDNYVPNAWLTAKVLAALLAIAALVVVGIHLLSPQGLYRDSVAPSAPQGAIPVVAEPYVAPAPQQSPTVFLQPYIEWHGDDFRNAPDTSGTSWII